MSNNNAAIVRSIYESVRKGNTDAFVEALDPSVVWNVAENFLYADGNPFVGPQAVVEGLFARATAEWDAFSHHLEKFVVDGDTVAVFGRYAAVSKLTGKQVDAQMVHVWELRNGKVVRFQQYTDTAQWRDAAMGSPPRTRSSRLVS
jgi:uncharacterized protein